MDVELTASDNVEYGSYGVLNRVYDSVDIISPGRVGNQGTLTFSIGIEASFSKFVNQGFLFQYASSGPGGGSIKNAKTTYSFDVLDNAGTHHALLKATPDDSPITFDPYRSEQMSASGTINVTYDIVFGDTLSYLLGQSHHVFLTKGPGGINSKMEIQSVIARDLGGTIVNARLVANSGLDLFALSPVPEPATWVSMTLGLGVTGLAFRRRRSKLAAA